MTEASEHIRHGARPLFPAVLPALGTGPATVWVHGDTERVMAEGRAPPDLQLSLPLRPRVCFPAGVPASSCILPWLLHTRGLQQSF